MVNLKDFNIHELDKKTHDFYLYNNDNAIVERFGLWVNASDSLTLSDNVKYHTYENKHLTKHQLYHNLNIGDPLFNTVLEGIQLSWEGNPLDIVVDDDYYKILKRR